MSGVKPWEEPLLRGHRGGVVGASKPTCGEAVDRIAVSRADHAAIAKDILQEIAGEEPDIYANSQGGASMIGVMLIGLMCSVFGGLIGFCLGSMR